MGPDLELVHLLHPVLEEDIRTKNLDSVRDAYAQLSEKERSVFDQEILNRNRQKSLGDHFVLEVENLLSIDTVRKIHSGEIDLSDVLKAAAKKISKEKVKNRRR